MMVQIVLRVCLQWTAQIRRARATAGAFEAPAFATEAGGDRTAPRWTPRPSSASPIATSMAGLTSTHIRASATPRGQDPTARKVRTKDFFAKIILASCIMEQQKEPLWRKLFSSILERLKNTQQKGMFFIHAILKLLYYNLGQ